MQGQGSWSSAKLAKYTPAASSAAGAPPPPPTTTFTWEVKNLTLESFTAAQPNVRWLSPEFDACGVRWQLSLHPALRVKDDIKMALYLKLVEPSCTILLGKATIACAGDPANALTRLHFSTLDPRPMGGCKSLGFCLFSHTELEEAPQIYIPGGVLTVTATLRPQAFAAVALPAEPKFHLVSDLRALLASGEDADVTFDAGDEILRAHSLVLALRSSTLKGLLRSGAKSSEPRVIKVPPEIQPVIFKQLLEYMYTDKVGLESAEHAQHMLHAADFYGVETLRSRCALELCKTLTTANVLVALTLAHQCSCPELRSYALRFIAANAPAVMQTAEWSELKRTHPELFEAARHTIFYGWPPATIVNEPAAAAESA